MNESAIEIRPVRGEAELDAVRGLFRAYAAGLGLDLGPLGFAAETEALPGHYGPPGGELLAAWRDGAAVGCVGLKAISGLGRCEIKRLYVSDAARGTGTGRALVLAAIAAARSLGHREMVLDTLPHLAAAIALYRALGFQPIPRFPESVIPSASCFGVALALD